MYPVVNAPLIVFLTSGSVFQFHIRFVFALKKHYSLKKTFFFVEFIPQLKTVHKVF